MAEVRGQTKTFLLVFFLVSSFSSLVLFIAFWLFNFWFGFCFYIYSCYAGKFQALIERLPQGTHATTSGLKNACPQHRKFMLAGNILPTPASLGLHLIADYPLMAEYKFLFN